jgi:hypothetical protein
MKAKIFKKALYQEVMNMCQSGAIPPDSRKPVMMLAFNLAGMGPGQKSPNKKDVSGGKNSILKPFTPPQQANAAQKNNSA